MTTAEILQAHCAALYALIDDAERDLHGNTAHEAEAFLGALHQAREVAEGAIAEAEAGKDEEEEEDEDDTYVDDGHPDFFDVGCVHVELPVSRKEFRHRYSCTDPYQPAYIRLRLWEDIFADEEAYLDAYFASETNGVPGDVYYDHTLRFPISIDSSVADVRDVMRRIAPLCAKLARTYTLDGLYGTYDERIYDAIAEITDEIDDDENGFPPDFDDDEDY